MVCDCSLASDFTIEIDTKVPGLCDNRRVAESYGSALITVGAQVKVVIRASRIGKNRKIS
jgi:hypothetical protein